MKRNFTRILAAFALLVGLTIPMGMWGQTWTRVTSADDLLAGGTFILGYEASANSGVIVPMQNEGTATLSAAGYMHSGTTQGSSTNGTLNMSNVTSTSLYEVTIVASTTVSGAICIKIGDSFLGNTNTKNNCKLFASESTTTAFTPIVKTNNTFELKIADNETYFDLQYNSGSPRFAVYGGTQKHPVIYKKEAGSTTTCATPTFSPAAGTYTEAQSVSISCATEGATIYYTTNGDEPTTNSTIYTAAIIVSTNTTIKAMATAQGYDNSAVATAAYTIVNIEHAGTEADPYTVADARAAIDANAGTQGVYATGIVSAIPTAWNGQYNNITFNFVDNEGDTDFLQAYRCVSTDNADASTVAVGDVVVVFGDLTKYGSTYEFNSGCQLVSLTHHQSPTITLNPTSINLGEGNATGEQISRSFTVSQNDLTTVISLSLEGNGSLNITSIDMGASPTTVTWTYTPTEAGSISATITATSTGAETQTLTITGAAVAPVTGDRYEMVTEAPQDWSGCYIITGTNSGDYYALTGVTSNLGTTAAVTVVGNSIESNSTTDGYQVIVAQTTNGYSLYMDGVGYLGYNSDATTSNNYLHVLESFEANTCEWTIAMTDGLATITNVRNNVRSLQFNYNNGNSRFACYTSSQVKPTLFKYTGTVVLPPVINVTENTVSLEYYETEGSIEYTITNPVLGTNLIATSEADWIEDITVGESAVTFTATENESTEDRTATITLSYTGAVDKVITINQAAYEAPTYAELPFAFNGGKADIEGTNGLYQEGLDSDYASNNTKLKFNGTGDWLLLQFSERPGTLTFDIKGYSFSGSTFALQTSENGVDFTTLKSYTNDNFGEDVYSEEFTDLGENVRYIKWVYTNKSSGNVGLGNITLGEYVAPQPSITVTPLEINVDAEYHQDVLTVTYTNVDPTSYTPVAIYYDAEGHETDCSWLWVELKSDKNFRYTIFANDGGARTAYFKIRCNGVYSDMVTVNQDAYVTPPTPGNWVLTSIDELTEEDVFVIVGDNGDTYAMSNDNGTSSAPAAVSVAVVDNTLSGEIGDNIQWNISSTESGYIFYPNGTTETWLYCTNTNNGVRVGVNDNNVFIIEDGYLKNFVTERYVGIYNSQDWRCYKLGTDGSFPANIADQTFAFYKKVEEESYDLTITGYTNDSEKTGYHLIASPVTFDPNGTDMTLGDFDLYYFDQEGDSEGNEWMNWESNHFSLVPGTGYLYAKKATPDAQTYYFTLSGEPYNEFGSIPLTYNSTAQFAGWNLIGNPFGEDATLDMPFYRMNGEGSGLEAVEETNSTVYAMEGVFVNAFDQDYGVLSYANFTRAGNTSGEGGMKINLTRNRGTVIDNAIVRFDNGRQLPKFQLFENSTKLYIPQGNKDFAIVRSAAQGEMPVSFRASENGTYTIAVEAENVEMNYLHLIDNMTGADVDLLATPNYTFEARTNDYTSRFRLVFSANGIDEQNAETFAFFNGTSWTVSNTGDATLQVVDITGRIVSSETINGNATISLNQPAGIYMLRLVNGNDVKVQKVVVR